MTLLLNEDKKKAYQQLETLKQILKSYETCIVAFSGGVDSTFLLQVAYDVLQSNVIAIIAKSSTYPEREFLFAENFVQSKNISYQVITSNESSDPRFLNNTKDRCYWCKQHLFSQLKKIAKRYEISHILEGSNFDDTFDYRPGIKVAQLLNIKSPLIESNFTKDQIRFISEEFNLPTWNKPSFACLSSRIPYGTKITDQLLKKINRAEEFLFNLSISQVRVRHHDTIARIEVFDKDVPIILTHKMIINKFFNELGYTYVVLDLAGYVSGSMNNVLLEL